MCFYAWFYIGFMLEFESIARAMKERYLPCLAVEQMLGSVIGTLFVIAEKWSKGSGFMKVRVRIWDMCPYE